MPQLSDFPYASLQFDKRGLPKGTQDDFLELIQSPNVSDLVFLCHGWKNDEADATALYEELSSNMRKRFDEPQPHPDVALDSMAFAGVFWPSKKFNRKELPSGGGRESRQRGDRRRLDRPRSTVSKTWSTPATQTRSSSASAASCPIWRTASPPKTSS